MGLAADLMREFAAAVTIMGGGDIVPTMDRGLLDGAEFNNPSSDRLLGFPDVSKTWMPRSYHQDCESFEIILNKAKHDSLPEEFQAILQNAAKAASSEMCWRAMDRYPRDLQAGSVMAYSLVLIEILVVINQQDTPPFLPPPVH